MSTQRKFSKEFKQAALQQLENGKRPTDLARELGIDRTTLYRWYYESKAAPAVTTNKSAPISGDQR